ncbi:MAG: hypothetical protein IJG51_11790 [Synergistaceae bacterium]|nr:hypothetical protein [Synergistaceae bacterium]MBQ6665876.1 hypothetical protein [Synergistaceae bacterium]
MYTMTLNDGTVIGNLKMVNNTLRSAEGLTAEMLRGKLAPVTIAGSKSAEEDEDWGGLVGTHEAMEVCYVKMIDGEAAVALADVDPERLRRERLEGNIEYIAMMTGVEL